MKHYPNFDAIRLFAAASVVFSHSFLIATGTEDSEPLSSTGVVAGVYGVFVFFILSGFLVTESARRSAALGDFIRKRFLRIMPALIVSTFVITYVICPWFDKNGAWAFVSHPEVFETAVRAITFHNSDLYFQNVAFYPPRSEIDFLPGEANGVLWTIRMEVIGYLFIGLMATLSLFNPRRWFVMLMILAAVVGVSSLLYVYAMPEWVGNLLFVLPSLCCGIFMNWLVSYHEPRGWVALVLLGGIAPAVYFEVLPQAFPFLAAYPLIWLGAAPVNLLPRFYEGTDLSYGVYLYGWPITQVIRGFVGQNLTGYDMTALA
ncbi:MAG: acyltransferase, partial [Pseudomonadales bacterium]|nr:acyltransferase [Pseudomonadales bacterium]